MSSPEKFYDISVQVTREEDGKRYWLRIGSAAALPDGDIVCTVASAPLHWDGKMRLFLVNDKKERAT